LAKTILYQKNELDKFFLETIDHIKSTIESEDGRSLRSKLPYSKNGILHWNLHLDHPKTGSKAKGEKVELSELDWHDKERIVRILFTKISMGVTPSYWKQIEKMAKEREMNEESAEEEREEDESEY